MTTTDLAKLCQDFPDTPVKFENVITGGFGSNYCITDIQGYRFEELSDYEKERLIDSGKLDRSRKDCVIKALILSSFKVKPNL